MKLPRSVDYRLHRRFIPYGSRPWLYVSIAMFAIRLARRFAAPRPGPLLRFQVKPGETFEVRGVGRGR